MNRLLLVSNRLPVTIAPGPDGLQVERSVGGLSAGLREPHERSRGLWIGWPGPLDPDTEQTRTELEKHTGPLGIVPVYLTRTEVHLYYEQFSNGVLWPLFHYLTGQVPLRVEGWEEYVTANRRFADAVAREYQAGDLIWVHDYQLLLVPAMVRRRLPGARIGFFLHVPFPTSELFATLPNREELLEGLLGADLIGFHTASYERHFRSALARLVGVDADDGHVAHQGRSIRIGTFPMGVDAEALARRAAQPDVIARAAELRAGSPGALLLGIDRLDYTKGIPRRFLAFEDLLARWPEWRGRVRMVQVAVPSRTGVRSYRRFRDEVNALVGRINGTFGTPDWVPVHYLYRSVPDDELLALYRAADVMLVTPVRDGMNLVAKEFVAARDDEDGALVLSEFAGAAAELQEALIVNPYDIEDTAEMYNRALTLSRSERRERMHALRSRVFAHNVHAWVASFLDALTDTAGKQLDTRSTPPDALACWDSIAARLEDKQPVLFLDYDGTLTQTVAQPDHAWLPRDVRTTLRRLSERLPVAIVSGRALDDVSERIGLPSLIYAGSHGFDIAGPDGQRHQVATDCVPALVEAAEELRRLTEGIGGVRIEEKRFSVAVHYRLVNRSDVPRIMDAIERVLAGQPGLEKRAGKKVVDLRPATEWDKGKAVLWIMEQLGLNASTAVPLFIGDDLTDEDAFAVTANRGIGIVIGNDLHPTQAQFSLPGVPEVKDLLERLLQLVAADAA